MQLPEISRFFNVIRYQTIGSTNAEAARLAALGPQQIPEGTLVLSGEQTDGRGRRGRHWNSPVGNLYTSLILRPDVPLRQAAQLGFVAALALYDAVQELCDGGLQVECKWPNDVLINGKKVSGILLESHGVSADEPADWLVLGVGVNVISFPEVKDVEATSLAHIGFTGTLERALLAYTGCFEKNYKSWLEAGFLPVRDRWRKCSKGIGDPIEVRLENQTLYGIFEDIDEDGVLLLRQSENVMRITAGDVFFPSAVSVS